MTGTACFFNWFLVKKGQNVRFQADFQGKPLIIRVAKLANFVSNTDQNLIKSGKLLIKIWSNTDQILITILSKSDEILIKYASNTDEIRTKYSSNTDHIRTKYTSNNHQIRTKYS